MRNVLDKRFSENRAVYEIMSKNVAEPDATSDVTIWPIRVAFCVRKTTRTPARTQTSV